LPDDVRPGEQQPSRRRQSAQEIGAVALGDHARIGDDDRASVSGRTDESAEPLLQPQRSVRNHVFGERVTAALDDRFTVRGGNGLGGDTKREVGDEQTAQCMTRYVYTFPVGRGADENCSARFAEPVEKNVPTFFAMYKQWSLCGDTDRPQPRSNVTHVPVAGEQGE
jgi:hypothetical protein